MVILICDLYIFNVVFLFVKIGKYLICSMFNIVGYYF